MTGINGNESGQPIGGPTLTHTEAGIATRYAKPAGRHAMICAALRIGHPDSRNLADAIGDTKPISPVPVQIGTVIVPQQLHGYMRDPNAA